MLSKSLKVINIAYFLAFLLLPARRCTGKMREKRPEREGIVFELTGYSCFKGEIRQNRSHWLNLFGYNTTSYSCGDTMASILVINGPNLNLLGSREPEIYGSLTLEDVNARLAQQCEAAGHEIQFLQSNSEAAIIDCIHGAKKEGVSFMILNPAALTHTSVALRDALLGVTIPFIEVHVSNVHAREEFRKHSFLSDIAVGTIVGLGTQGYDLALAAAIARIE